MGLFNYVKLGEVVEEEEKKKEENTTWYHEGPQTLKIGQSVRGIYFAKYIGGEEGGGMAAGKK